MTEQVFDVFDTASTPFELVTSPDAQLMNCVHVKVSDLDGTIVCLDCGAQIDELLVDNETCFYGSSDTRYQNDPSRHNISHNDERSLYADLEARSFPQNIIERANEDYKNIVKDKIYRAKNRISIVFVCTLKAYESLEIFNDPNELAKTFGLDKKGISIGLKIYSKVFRKCPDKKHMMAINFVPQLIKDLQVPEDYRDVMLSDITKIDTFVKSKSKIFNSSNPKSIASGLVYYYLKLTGVEISRYDFAQITGLTDITFTKISRDIYAALDTPKKIKF